MVREIDKDRGGTSVAVDDSGHDGVVVACGVVVLGNGPSAPLVLEPWFVDGYRVGGPDVVALPCRITLAWLEVLAVQMVDVHVADAAVKGEAAVDTGDEIAVVAVDAVGGPLVDIPLHQGIEQHAGQFDVKQVVDAVDLIVVQMHAPAAACRHQGEGHGVLPTLALAYRVEVVDVADGVVGVVADGDVVGEGRQQAAVGHGG